MFLRMHKNVMSRRDRIRQTMMQPNRRSAAAVVFGQNKIRGNTQGPRTPMSLAGSLV